MVARKKKKDKPETIDGHRCLKFTVLMMTERVGILDQCYCVLSVDIEHIRKIGILIGGQGIGLELEVISAISLTLY